MQLSSVELYSLAVLAMFSGICSLIFSSQGCKSLRHFAQLHQNSWANANSSPKLFGFPSPILSISGCTTVVILLDIAHVVAGYRELAKGFEPIRNEEIVSRYVRGTQRECKSKPLKRSIVERILVFKR